MAGKPLGIVVPTVDNPEVSDLGPAMLKLTEIRRRFVIALVEEGFNPGRAAKAAGYNDSSEGYLRKVGWNLMQDEEVLAAIKEVGVNMLHSGSLAAVKTVLDILDNPQNEAKDRLKAAEMIMNRAGMPATTEHKVAVTHTSKTSEEMVKRIEQLSAKFGLDTQKLLGDMVIEAKFEEVKPEDDLSDLY